MSDPQPKDSGNLRNRWWLIAARLAVIFALVWAGLQAIELANETLIAAGKTPDNQAMRAAFWGMAALYSVVLAIPFVPGVEIGLSMMMIRGAEAALPVYLATLIGLSLAYVVGRYIPCTALSRWLAGLGLARAAEFVLTHGQRPRDEKLESLRRRLPKVIRWLIVDYRYVALAVLLNIPGNAVIGGGGGIMLIAGLSRLFDTRLIILTLIIAVAPVPLAFLVLGQQ